MGSIRMARAAVIATATITATVMATLHIVIRRTKAQRLIHKAVRIYDEC